MSRTVPAMPPLADAAERLRRLHHGGGPLVLPNAWDAASARAVVASGFPVVATTSAGLVNALGFDDHEQAPVDEVFAAVRRIADAVSDGVPVTADLEAGYRLAPAELVERLLAAGGVGLNLEDSDHHGPGPLVDAGQQADRIAAVVAAGRAAGVDVAVNARVDVHIRAVGEEGGRLAEALRRGRAYLAAGATCVYPIGVADEPTIAALVDGVGGPVNVLARPGAPSLARLAELGVARVSFGAGLMRSTQAHLAGLLARIKDGETP
jgi:2-methylisocitrate lyase-like PEP mutase family enzyme